ncbi:hypothetical protein RF55_12924 [Lasius niger]|uniref:Uncharacterized protein n=1 Tax=Lasius niger TaxID=67767 RepID=A0A0J7KBH3_LASNI|nr:hypothetical protein RF55_12924 [Lasius niger]
MIDMKQVPICLRREEELVPSSSGTRGLEPPVGVAAEQAVYVPDMSAEPFPKKRKQGRPETTGVYERLKARKAEE